MHNYSLNHVLTLSHQKQCLTLFTQVWVILFTLVVTSTAETLWIKLTWCYCIADEIPEVSSAFLRFISHHLSHSRHSNVVYRNISAFDSMTLDKNWELYIVTACLIQSTASRALHPNSWDTLHHCPWTQKCTDSILVSDIGADPEKKYRIISIPNIRNHQHVLALII